MLLPYSRQCGAVVWMVMLCGLTVADNNRKIPDSSRRQQSEQQRAVNGPTDAESPRSRPSVARPPRQTVVKATRRAAEKPNIVFVITDDQDVELGSLDFMPKTARALRDKGATFSNAFTTTPMCCPSRSSMLTGMYVHNHNVYTNNDNCSSEQWRQTHETLNFGTYLTNAGYRTGFFGKYLNEYSGAYIPPGWTEWLGLIRNTRFYNYTVNHNGQKIKHEDNYYKDYLTDLIANSSVMFLRESKNLFPNRPVAMVLSMPAPHGPEDAAPQYQHMFMDVKTHRTPSWNFAPNPDKQWLLQYTGKMTTKQIAFTDILQTKRLQTLQSVDDAVEKVVGALEELDELDNTYVIYTSDHGYHLGQYGLVKGKAMPYDFDIRIPFYIRGPKISPGIRVPSIVLNLDIAPTLLDIAGIPTPEHMDGSSILKLFDGQPDSSSGVRRRRAWRDTFLVERGKLTSRKLKVQEKLEARFNNLVTTKEQRLEEECQKAEFQPPCKPQQQWECRRNEHGRLRIYKCRPENATASAHATAASQYARKCVCKGRNADSAGDREMDAEEIQRQLEFLQHHVNQPRMVEPRFIAERIRRDVRKMPRSRKTASTMSPRTTQFVSDGLNVSQTDVKNGSDNEEFVYTTRGQVQSNDSEPVEWIPVNAGQDDMTVPCRLTVNGTVICERYVYSDVQEWMKQKSKIESIIHDYQHRVSVLESIRTHLMRSQPAVAHPVTKTNMKLSTQSFSAATTVATTFIDSLSTVASTVNKIRFTTPLEGLRELDSPDDGEDTDDEDSDNEEDPNMSLVDEDDCICESEEMAMTSSSRLSVQRNRKHESKLQTLARDVASQEERETQRRQKLEKSRLEKAYSALGRRQRNRKTDKQQTHQSFDCNSPDVFCSESFTSPSPSTPGAVRQAANPWDGVDFAHISSRRDPVCHIDGLECSRMDDEHWKTAPFWTHGPFCICPNSNNNTYWCLRTVNESHNFLYCEFITGFISYYDMKRDPYQLRNAVHDLSFAILHQLHDTLELMKGCKGSRKCNLRAKTLNAEVIDDHRDSSKHLRHDGKGPKINDQPADTTRSKWMRTKGVRHG